MAGLGGVRSGPVTHHDVDKEGGLDSNSLSGMKDQALAGVNKYALKMFNAMEESRLKALGIGVVILGLAALFTFVMLPNVGWNAGNPSLGSAMMPIIGGAATGLGLYALYCAFTGKKLREKIAEKQGYGDFFKGLLGLGLVGFGAWAVVSSGVGNGWGGNGWFYIGVAATSLAATVLGVRAYSKYLEVETIKQDISHQNNKFRQQQAVEMHSLQRGGQAHRAQSQATAASA